MSHPVTTIGLDDSLKLIKEIFEQNNFHHLLVAEANILRGVISDRDLLKALSPNAGRPAETAKDAASLNKKAHQIMSRKLITLQTDDGIYTAISHFNQYGVSCLPVLNQHQRPVGIISWRDIMKLIEDTQKKLHES